MKKTDFNDKKVVKRIIRLIYAIKRSTDEDLILLAALSKVAIILRDGNDNDNTLQIYLESYIENISNNSDIVKLLNK